MSLKEELDALNADFKAKMPDMVKVFNADTDEMVARGIGSSAPEVGDIAPAFELPDQLGHMISSNDLLSKGPLVVSFYRGSWCPYCNVEMRALLAHLPRITSAGASLVAISPELPDASLTDDEKEEALFPILSDAGNVVARSFGLVFTLSEHLRPMYKEFGIDLPARNGTETYELPVPATFVIDKDSTILAMHAHADYKQRMEPEEILRVLG